jgi:hypothetical protein
MPLRSEVTLPTSANSLFVVVDPQGYVIAFNTIVRYKNKMKIKTTFSAIFLLGIKLVIVCSESFAFTFSHGSLPFSTKEEG